MKACLAILVTIGSLTGVYGYQTDRTAKEKETLQGTWTLVRLVDGGNEQLKDDLKRRRITIKGDSYVHSIDELTFHAVYRIDPAKTPKQMDITFEDGPQKGLTMLAIYSLDGDELKICGGLTRPTEFFSKPNSEMILFVCKREKP
jgi:uncharacterized protein (TIGR03067 family)